MLLGAINVGFDKIDDEYSSRYQHNKAAEIEKLAITNLNPDSLKDQDEQAPTDSGFESGTHGKSTQTYRSGKDLEAVSLDPYLSTTPCYRPLSPPKIAIFDFYSFINN